MTCEVEGLPATFKAGRYKGVSDEIDLETTENVAWVARLGSQTYGNATVAGGRVYVGTNNEPSRDARFEGDRSALLCLDAASGERLWELSVPKLGTGQVSDWEHLGICSSPAVDGDRVYVVTTRGEVACLDVKGMADGNDGPFEDEGLYLAWPSEEPLELAETDADILWVFDMIGVLGVQPHNVTSSSPLVVGDHVWASTSNGRNVDHDEIPAPEAPSLILLDKLTGKLLAQEASGLSARLLHANWTSPAYLKTDELELAIFGGPDGWVYAFEPEPQPVQEGEGPALLKERWRCDANPPELREKDGEPVPYGHRDGPSEIIGTPLVWEGKVYAQIGQDPEYGEGSGNLVCIDPSGEGDVTGSHILWSFGEIHRSLSSMACRDGLLFTADYPGFIYCLDAQSGERVWVHDTMGRIWASPVVVDGRLFLGNEDGYMTVIPATREYERGKVVEIDVRAPVYSSLVVAGGVMYFSTHTHLYAVAQ